MLALIDNALLTLAVAKGMGLHTADLPQEQANEAMKSFWIAQGLAMLAAPFCRVAVISLIVHIQGSLLYTVRTPMKTNLGRPGPTYKLACYLLWSLGIFNVCTNPLLSHVR